MVRAGARTIFTITFITAKAAIGPTTAPTPRRVARGRFRSDLGIGTTAMGTILPVGGSFVGPAGPWPDLRQGSATDGPG